MIDHRSLRRSATLLLLGQLLYIMVTQFHTGGDANDHHAIFAAYAGSGIWTGVHVAQFAGMAVLLAGLIELCFALNVSTRAANWVGRSGAASATVALALYGALQAVDGVANKQADLAWVSAPAVEKVARFASAEALRWIEWGMRSYHDFALGLALVLVAALIAQTASLPRPMAYLLGLSGLAYLVQGWVVGTQGFSQSMSTVIVLAWALCLAWMIWLLLLALRMRRTEEPPARLTTPPANQQH